jgi:hypothetical protein
METVFRIKIIEGKMRAGGGATSLFIDWIAAGGYYRRPVVVR